MQLVLLIESDLHSLRELERNLSGNRFRVVNTSSPRKGLDFAKSAPPDLILLGFQVKEKETLDVLAALKKDSITKRIPILALLRTANQQFIDHLQMIGVADSLIKPIKQNVLLFKVSELLQISENIKEDIVKETQHHISIPLNNDQRTIIVFRSGIRNYVLPELRNVLSHDFIKSIINKHICIDFRTIPEMTLEELQILEKILKLFGEKKVSLITGTHLGFIMKNSDLPDSVNLFLSMDDYELFLQNPELDE